MVAVGIFADQIDNAALVDDLGVAFRLLKDELNEPRKILFALDQVLSNASFQEKANHLSAVWQDELISPKVEAIYWIELLLKYGNLRHLKIDDNDLTLFQYFSLDVILFLLGLLILPVFCLILLFRKPCQIPAESSLTKTNGKLQLQPQRAREKVE